MTRPAKRSTPPQFPPEYRAASLQRDRWFALGTLGTILALVSTAIGMLFSPALIIVLAPAAFTLYAFARFFILEQRAAKLLVPWMATHPYQGRAPKILGTFRRLALTQPIAVGVVISAAIFGLLMLVILVRHHLSG